MITDVFYTVRCDSSLWWYWLYKARILLTYAWYWRSCRFAVDIIYTSWWITYHSNMIFQRSRTPSYPWDCCVAPDPRDIPNIIVPRISAQWTGRFQCGIRKPTWHEAAVHCVICPPLTRNPMDGLICFSFVVDTVQRIAIWKHSLL